MSSFEGPPKNPHEKNDNRIVPDGMYMDENGEFISLNPLNNAEVDALAHFYEDNSSAKKLPEMLVSPPLEKRPDNIVNLVQRHGRSESRTSAPVDERAVANFFGGRVPLPSNGRDVRNLKALPGISPEKEVDIPVKKTAPRSLRSPILRVPNIDLKEGEAPETEVSRVSETIEPGLSPSKKRAPRASEWKAVTSPIEATPPGKKEKEVEKEVKEPKEEKIESKLAPIIPLTVEEQAEIQKRREAASVIAKFTGKTQRFFGGLGEGIKNAFLEGWNSRVREAMVLNFDTGEPLRVMWRKGWENRAAGKVAEVNTKLFNKKQELANTEALAKKHATMAESLSKKGISPDVAFKLEKEKIAMRDAVLEIKRNIETLSEESRSREKTLVSYKREREILAEGLFNRVEKILAPYEKKF